MTDMEKIIDRQVENFHRQVENVLCQFLDELEKAREKIKTLEDEVDSLKHINKILQAELTFVELSKAVFGYPK